MTRMVANLNKITWKLQSLELANLTDYSKNPRTLSEKEFKQLKKSLDTFGLIDKPIVNADVKHTVIGGHQRKRVLEASGQEPVILSGSKEILANVPY